MPSPPAQAQLQPIKPISEAQDTNHASEKVIPASVPPPPKLVEMPHEKPAPMPKTEDKVEATSLIVEAKTQEAEPPTINETVQSPMIKAAVPEAQVAAPIAKPEEIVKPTEPPPVPIPAVPQQPPAPVQSVPVQSVPVNLQKSVSDLPPLPPAREKICKYCKKRIPISSTRCPYCSHDLG
jgi:hypothetical protein